MLRIDFSGRLGGLVGRGKAEARLRCGAVGVRERDKRMARGLRWGCGGGSDGGCGGVRRRMLRDATGTSVGCGGASDEGCGGVRWDATRAAVGCGGGCDKVANGGIGGWGCKWSARTARAVSGDRNTRGRKRVGRMGS